MEIENDLVSEGTESGDDYKKYEDMNEHDKFDVYQEISFNICWSGFQKCMECNEDNELLGVNVEKIRDDYNNQREESFYCEKCTFSRKDMEDVKKHFEKKHIESYSCCECDKLMDSMTDFKRHYGSFHFMVERKNVNSF